MDEITLQDLLEAGCHFGHKAERWHPKAAKYIYSKQDGIHIIDLSRTKAGLEKAVDFIKDLAQAGGTVLFVGTKRQAKGIVREEAESAGAPYLCERWIGGFLTNWEAVSKNIAKINHLSMEAKTGAWKKFPKHEQVKLSHYLERLKIFYGGVLTLNKVPDAVYIVDIKKEDVVLREARRCEIPVVAIVDTNSNPEGISYVIPANDDAVGSIKYITQKIAKAYLLGKTLAQKKETKEKAPVEVQKEAAIVKQEEGNMTVKDAKVKTEEKVKHGRPKKRTK